MARRALRRAGAGLVDQALYSVANFALTIVVARAADPAGFGAYALVSTTYVVVLAVARGLTSETFVVRYSARTSEGRDRSRWLFGAGAGAGVALVVGLVTGVVLVVVGLVVDQPTVGTTAVVFGALLPGLVVQDYLRFVALARGTPSTALLCDGVTVAVQAVATGALLATDRAGVPALVLAWGASAWVGAVVGGWALQVWPRPDRCWYWFTRHRDLAVRYAIDDLASQGSQQVSGYIVAAVDGLADTGALRAAQTVFGPPSIANLGVSSAVTPELVRLLGRDPRKMRLFTMGVGVGLGLLGLVWGVVALVIPDSVGREVLGRTWDLAQPLLVFLLIAQVAQGLRVGPMAGLRALGDARRTLRARTVTTVIALATTVAGAFWDGARGVAIALAVATPLMAVVWWFYFRAAFQHRVAAGADPDLVTTTPPHPAGDLPSG